MQPRPLTQLLVGVVVAIVAALLGAAYQAYRRRSRPFLIVLRIYDEATEIDEATEDDEETEPENKEDARIPVDPEAARQLKSDSIAMLAIVNEIDTPSNIRLAVQTCQGLISRGSNGIKALEKAIEDLDSAQTDTDILEAIRSPLNYNIFDAVTMLAAFRGAITFPTVNRGEGPKITVHYLQRRGGSYEIDIPGQPGLPFLVGMDRYEGVRARVQPFIEAITFLDRSALKTAFERLLAILRNDLGVARSVHSLLAKFLEQNSRWKSDVHLANYGETAMLLLQSGALEVRDNRSRKRIIEPCRLEYHRARGASKASLMESTGVLVPPDTDIRLVFATTRSQSEMPAGNELRGKYQDKTSKARIRFDFISAGVRSRKTAKTTWTQFS